MHVKAKMYKCTGHVTRNLRKKMSENAIASNIEWHTNKSVYATLYEAGVEDAFGDSKFIQFSFSNTAVHLQIV